MWAAIAVDRCLTGRVGRQRGSGRGPLIGGEVHRGTEAISAFWDMTRQMTPEIELTVTGPVRVAGANAAFPGEARPLLGEDRMMVPVIDVLAFDEAGKITQLRAFWDFADLRPAE